MDENNEVKYKWQVICKIKGGEAVEKGYESDVEYAKRTFWAALIKLSKHPDFDWERGLIIKIGN